MQLKKNPQGFIGVFLRNKFAQCSYWIHKALDNHSCSCLLVSRNTVRPVGARVCVRVLFFVFWNKPLTMIINLCASVALHGVRACVYLCKRVCTHARTLVCVRQRGLGGAGGRKGGAHSFLAGGVYISMY